MYMGLGRGMAVFRHLDLDKMVCLDHCVLPPQDILLEHLDKKAVIHTDKESVDQKRIYKKRFNCGVRACPKKPSRVFISPENKYLNRTEKDNHNEIMPILHF